MHKHFLLSASLLVLTVCSASAQSFQEGLFLEENRTAFRYNPAAAGNTDFLSVGNFMNGGIANFGGMVPVRKTPLEACRRLLSAGLTFDLS